jgi:hypothetical protein
MYRDDVEAAHHRADALQHELDRTHRELLHARQQLAIAADHRCDEIELDTDQDRPAPDNRTSWDVQFLRVVIAVLAMACLAAITDVASHWF